MLLAQVDPAVLITLRAFRYPIEAFWPECLDSAQNSCPRM
jgi:hypothetical protein